jgi:hypothetical protein
VRAARLLRGAGYVAFTSAAEIPDQRDHSAIASTYAHVTAPLRRVCDRYANEVLMALCAGTTPPAWAVDTLTELPSIMGKARTREGSLDRTMVDYIESVVLADALGDHFDATVVNHRQRRRPPGRHPAGRPGGHLHPRGPHHRWAPHCRSASSRSIPSRRLVRFESADA